jgi:hypothetical protein
MNPKIAIIVLRIHYVDELNNEHKLTVHLRRNDIHLLHYAMGKITQKDIIKLSLEQNSKASSFEINQRLSDGKLLYDKLKDLNRLINGETKKNLKMKRFRKRNYVPSMITY